MARLSGSHALLEACPINATDQRVRKFAQAVVPLLDQYAPRVIRSEAAKATRAAAFEGQTRSRTRVRRKRAVVFTA